MTQPVQEVVVYRITEADRFDAIRIAAEAEVRKLPGWLGWSHLVASDDPAQRVDLVSWRDGASAAAAGREVGEAKRFAPFRQAIAAVTSFGHYHTDAPSVPSLSPSLGIELGRFQLRAGSDESAMKAAYRAMVDGFLSQQQGWVGQWLVGLGDGAFVDVALATSVERAREICASWIGNDLCEAFMAYVEDDDMAFGTVL